MERIALAVSVLKEIEEEINENTTPKSEHQIFIESEINENKETIAVFEKWLKDNSSKALSDSKTYAIYKGVKEAMQLLHDSVREFEKTLDKIKSNNT